MRDGKDMVTNGSDRLKNGINMFSRLTQEIVAQYCESTSTEPDEGTRLASVVKVQTWSYLRMITIAKIRFFIGNRYFNT